MSTTFQGPPIRTPFTDPKSGQPVWAWMQFFLSIVTKFNLLFENPPAVTGSRGGNAALASLLTALDAQGYIKDNTTV